MPLPGVEALKAMIDGHGFVRLPEKPSPPVAACVCEGRGSEDHWRALSRASQRCILDCRRRRRRSCSSPCWALPAGLRFPATWSRRNDAGGAYPAARRDRTQRACLTASASCWPSGSRQRLRSRPGHVPAPSGRPTPAPKPPRGVLKPSQTSVTTIPATREPPSGSFWRRCASIRGPARAHWRSLQR